MKHILLLIFVVVLPLYLNARSKHATNDTTHQERVDDGIRKATYYGNNYSEKRRTANGEVFNKNAMTCASKVHPFGTLLKVTNTKNGKSVVVRVTDRGGFSSNKIALTYGAWGEIADLAKDGKPDYKAGVLSVKVIILSNS